MQYGEFLGRVQHNARLASQEEAVAATRAVLTALGERLDGGLRHNLAAQLPQELGRYLEEAEAGSLAGGAQAFTHRVGELLEREGDGGRVVHATRAVLDVLEEAVTPGQWEKVLAQLPPEMDRLATAGSHGERRRDLD
jgi:uncharacterized protein (DUF2267 family)